MLRAYDAGNKEIRNDQHKPAMHHVGHGLPAAGASLSDRSFGTSSLEYTIALYLVWTADIIPINTK